MEPTPLEARTRRTELHRRHLRPLGRRNYRPSGESEKHSRGRRPSAPGDENDQPRERLGSSPLARPRTSIRRDSIDASERYGDEVLSHLKVASDIKSGLADAGIGVRAAAAICGLDFVPLQRERYDLVIPKAHYESLRGIRTLLDL